MKRIATSLFGACIALACVSASAQDTMKKAEPMPGAGMMKQETLCANMIAKGPVAAEPKKQ